MALRRRLLIPLHWAGGACLAAVAFAGPGTARLAAVPLLAWAALLLGGGPVGRPGPALTGALRTVHRVQHLALYALLTASGLLALAGHASAATIALAALSGGAVHACFHLWRHTALNDGALRAILPRALHGLL